MKKTLFLLFAICLLASCTDKSQSEYLVKVKGHEKIAKGPFEPTWESLNNYEIPEWFRDAKLGIWAHWGPQCAEGTGDWMARGMYMEGSDTYKYHLEHYGHPSEVGFKDVIPYFKAEHWNPDSLLAYYKSIGAKYFFALGNHHDNFDNWDSKYQEWNSVNMGPKKDLLAGWAKAAKKNGLPFGISFHGDHAWTFYEVAQRHDTLGPYKGIPYDGKLTKADGKGKWWEGYDPQHLYAQNHKLTNGKWNEGIPFKQWEWLDGVDTPTSWYVSNFYDRTLDAINKYDPDLIYFDVIVYPFYPISDAGLRIAAHMYNHNMQIHNGKNEAVMFGKNFEEEHKEAMVWDVERGATGGIQEHPWQSCSCIGGWHYSDAFYQNNWYKSASTVVKLLMDIVSKNGNLLLSVPLRSDGTFDEKEKAILDEFGAWMKQNGEAVYGTRPWTVFGEGPLAETASDGESGHTEKAWAKAGNKDIRFTKKGDVLYATILAWPDMGASVTIKSLAGKDVSSVEILGYGPVKYNSTDKGLVVSFPEERVNEIAPVLKIK